ncbi:MAG TPA: mersacidin/lichenicidin family type 2 lantibiotic [Thermoanaerobaculia bacterium]|jgi:mersacidin/lichenicidin family type 2 lantibiotic|nr:mersacidin/lichenicidin family type 2 lantibiotic [Thermoanaerobaculia bacterium]
MKKVDVIRAWRDAEYRNSLPEDVRAALPEHPAGFAAVDDDLLKGVSGSATLRFCTTPDASCVPPGSQCP